MNTEALNTSNGLNVSSGSTFNLEKINMMNEARLKNLDKMGGYGNYDHVMADKGKNNYYNGPGLQQGSGGGSGNKGDHLLETIKEKEDDDGGELAKLDNLLLNYYKSNDDN
mmetsp:Transcript_10944/g.9433  ORF Transcript_10944/g.9433 Transcript_10944/m.9433 type:complete len:111 (+) Transcript_10944:3063-3395(+)